MGVKPQTVANATYVSGFVRYASESMGYGGSNLTNEESMPVGWVASELARLAA